MKDQCCDRLLPEEWDQKEIIWRDKPFYKSHYGAFLHVPLNIGKKIIRGMKNIQESGLMAENMVLVKNDTLWGADILIPIREKTDRFKTEVITGKFFTSLFEGHYGEMGHWLREVRKRCRAKGLNPSEYIFWYATCPKCAKKYGDKIQTVIFAKFE